MVYSIISDERVLCRTLGSNEKNMNAAKCEMEMIIQEVFLYLIYNYPVGLKRLSMETYKQSERVVKFYIEE